MGDLLVGGNRCIPLVGHVPLVETEDSAGLKALVDLPVNALKGRGVARGLDGVDWERSVGGLDEDMARTSVDGVLAEGLAQLHEIGLLERDLVAQASQSGLLGSSINLEVVVVDANDSGVGETSDLPSRSTDTATDVEDFHAWFDADLRSEIVLLSGELLRQTWARPRYLSACSPPARKPRPCRSGRSGKIQLQGSISTIPRKTIQFHTPQPYS